MSSHHSICRLPLKSPAFNCTAPLLSLLCLASLSSEPQHTVFLIILCRWFAGGKRNHPALWNRRTYIGSKILHIDVQLITLVFRPTSPLHFPWYLLPSNSRPFWGFVGQTGLLYIAILLGRHLATTPFGDVSSFSSICILSSIIWINSSHPCWSPVFFIIFVFVLVGLCLL